MTLISVERAQKLDLLLHLIANLNQSLVLCGPNGIGKTTLLKAIRELKHDYWPICWIDGVASLSYENILEQLTQQLTQMEPKFTGQGFAETIQHYAQKNSKVVLIIDDAGKLVPGLITALLQLANVTAELRLILALTHDELHIKSSSDGDINDCHIIELPPLNQAQCLTFLQNLSSQKEAVISYQAINEGLVENLYRETHGIPGRIVEELPRLSQYQPKPGVFWSGALFIGVAIVVAGFYYWHSQRQLPTTQPTLTQNQLNSIQPNALSLSNDEGGKLALSVTPEVLPDQTDMVTVPNGESSPKESANSFSKPISAPSTAEIIEQPAESVVIQPEDISTEGIDSGERTLSEEAVKPQDTLTSQLQTNENKQDQPKSTAVKELKEQQEAAKLPELIPEQADTVAQTDIDKPITDSQWLEQQPREYFTLQLMVLSTPESVTKLEKHYPDLQDAMKSIKIQRLGKTRYVVLYGSYETAELAEKTKKSLPKALRKAWIRPISELP